MAAPHEARVPYCACTMRRLNLDGTLTNTICDLCNRHFPDDKTVYMVLKDDVKHLRFLECKRMAKRKNTDTTNDKGAIMDAIDSLAYREDIHSLFTRYDCNVVCASIKVLVNNASPELRSLLSSSLENPLPAAEPEKVAEEEVVWDTEPKPAIELYDYPCDPEVAVEEVQGIKNTEPEATEEEYVCVPAMKEKPCDDDFSALDDDGCSLASYKSGGPEEEPPRIGADPAEVCESPAEGATPSDEEPGEERAQKKKEPTYLPFGSQYKLMVQLQGVLEGACFAYAQRRLLALLRRREWNCAEAVPLHTWIYHFTSIRCSFDTEPSKELLESVAEIEDTTVKRTPIDGSRMKKLLDNAIKLTEVLQTHEHGTVIKRIRADVAKAIQDLQQHKQEIQEAEERELLSIHDEREKLNKRERLVQAEKERKMGECQQSAGLAVIKALDIGESRV